MEKITNYKLKDFLRLEQSDVVESTLPILELLQPLKQVKHPKVMWYQKNKFINIKPIKSLLFGEVTSIRENLNDPSIENIIEAVSSVTDLPAKDILEFTIIDFWGILNSIKADVLEITNMELNELTNDDFDIDYETVNAGERMARFGVLNPINSLAGDDLTKWSLIEKMPYMTVFTKLMMDKVKADIQRDVAELQKKKQKNV